jgi:uncharacterized protein (DUF486 family)
MQLSATASCGYTELSLPQLKILQEASLCIMGAVYFIFRG